MISILNGLGHCVSHSSVLKHDTALAEKSLNTSKELPERVMPGKFATVVVDNADFGGEAKYQTHITNTIVVQNLTENHVFEKSNANKSRKKALKAPDINIDEYAIMKKKSPSFKYNQVNLFSYESNIFTKFNYKIFYMSSHSFTNQGSLHRLPTFLSLMLPQLSNATLYTFMQKCLRMLDKLKTIY